MYIFALLLRKTLCKNVKERTFILKRKRKQTDVSTLIVASRSRVVLEVFILQFAGYFLWLFKVYVGD